MELVIDATILFTALIGMGVTKEIIFSNSVKLYSPGNLFDEIEEHKARIVRLSGLSISEFDTLLDAIKIECVSLTKFEKFLMKANLSISDKDDTSYLALAISLNIPIWSNDPHFKQQSLIKVFTTSELVSELKSLGLLV